MKKSLRQIGLTLVMVEKTTSGTRTMLLGLSGHKPMAENDKNRDRFFQPSKVRTYASTSSTTFPSVIATGPGTVVDVSDSPMVTWTIQVSGVPVSATSWSVALEGSVDGVNFNEVLKHTTLTGDKQNLFSGTTLFLAKYYRINVLALTLGPASSITVSVIGKQ